MPKVRTDPEVLGGLMRGPKDRALVTALMHDLMARVTRDRTGCLALPEVDACSDLSLSESLNRGSAAKLRLCAIFNLFG